GRRCAGVCRRAFVPDGDGVRSGAGPGDVADRSQQRTERRSAWYIEFAWREVARRAGSCRDRDGADAPGRQRIVDHQFRAVVAPMAGIRGEESVDGESIPVADTL